jgi:hypothetical protein
MYEVKLAVFWVVEPLELVDVYRRFRGASCSIIRAMIPLMMEAAGTSEKSVNFYQTT